MANVFVASYSPDDHVLDFQTLCQFYSNSYFPQEGHFIRHIGYVLTAAAWMPVYGWFYCLVGWLGCSLAAF